MKDNTFLKNKNGMVNASVVIWLSVIAMAYRYFIIKYQFQPQNFPVNCFEGCGHKNDGTHGRFVATTIH